MLSWLRRSKKMMCSEMVELVTDYLEGRLPKRDHERFESHVAMCDECPKYLDQMRLTIAATGKLSADDVSDEAMNDLLSAFRTWTDEG